MCTRMSARQMPFSGLAESYRRRMSSRFMIRNRADVTSPWRTPVSMVKVSLLTCLPFVPGTTVMLGTWIESLERIRSFLGWYRWIYGTVSRTLTSNLLTQQWGIVPHPTHFHIRLSRESWTYYLLQPLGSRNPACQSWRKSCDNPNSDRSS